MSDVEEEKKTDSTPVDENKEEDEVDAKVFE
jgi:hypothetical protein